MSKMFAGDILQAAKSDSCFDQDNAEAISDLHGVCVEYVRKEIAFVRKNLHRIEPDFNTKEKFL